MYNFQKKRMKIQDFTCETNFFFGTLSFSIWAMLATWLYPGAFHKIFKNAILSLFECLIIPNAYIIGIERA
jgi:hypothetical protein